jgi:hypothetical protein
MQAGSDFAKVETGLLFVGGPLTGISHEHFIEDSVAVI